MYKKKEYFEGWYVKQQTGQETICFIPAYHIDHQGRESASVQVITPESSWFFPYEGREYGRRKKPFSIKVGRNLFTENGVRIQLESDQIQIKGKLRFDCLTRLPYSIMGPFQFFPHMQCSHSIISMHHKVNGVLNLNERKIEFQNGTGYMESDKGCSFPSSYLWVQCNRFQNRETSLFLSIANIPFAGTHFTGCICNVLYKGRQYRLATYLGAKVTAYSPAHVALKQNSWLLSIDLPDWRGQPLKAPRNGSMDRTIIEIPSCEINCRFQIGDKLLFQQRGKQASFENA